MMCDRCGFTYCQECWGFGAWSKAGNQYAKRKVEKRAHEWTKNNGNGAIVTGYDNDRVSKKTLKDRKRKAAAISK